MKYLWVVLDLIEMMKFVLVVLFGGGFFVCILVKLDGMYEMGFVEECECKV